ncbi:pentatricopeptide (PPR) repeat-containing protein [Actinidia rufa]|uniref:Pentatricopeptide (PPR) repeat-containing protein n=1 Tax=Actinidia rufa TaxID=165716 RepID=A0A7J0H1U3_9ERIC|nr:pentatricopeptide (PPR) repeat-containing protein [Actinidia rufa]
MESLEMGILSTLPRPRARRRQHFNSDQLMSILMVALASSVEMTWRGSMDSFYLGQEGSEIGFGVLNAEMGLHRMDVWRFQSLGASLKPWQKALLFFNWIKTHNLFPMEIIFYNIAMKSLRYGRQFQLIEDLASEMINNETGLMPDEVTYSAILDVYANLGKVEEVMSLYERGRASGWRPDSIAFAVLGKMYGEVGDYDGIRFVLEEMKALEVEPNLVVYNTLLETMGKAGKPGLARSLFEEMVENRVNPDEKNANRACEDLREGGGKVEKAMKVFDKMLERGVELSVMGCTCLVQCLGRAKRIDDMRARTETRSSRFLQQANLELVAFIKLLGEEITSFETIKKEFRNVLSATTVDARRPFCNCLIDICRNRNLHERAHELLYVGTVYGLYPGLHTKTSEEWRLNARSLSIGAAHTAFEEWMGTLGQIVKCQEALPEVFFG